MENDTMNNTTTSTPKMTKAQKFALLKSIPAVAENAMLVEFIDHEVELLTKKNSTEKKPTAKQTANEGIKDEVLKFMGEDPTRLFTVTELTKEVPNLPEDMSVNRMTALLRQLKNAGLVERTEDKRKALFRIIVAE